MKVIVEEKKNNRINRVREIHVNRKKISNSLNSFTCQVEGKITQELSEEIDLFLDKQKNNVIRL